MNKTPCGGGGGACQLAVPALNVMSLPQALSVIASVTHPGWRATLSLS